jgi:hypothetical protein
VETRNQLLQNLLLGVSNHIVEITLRHDASRIIQTLIQFGTDQQREKVLAELSPKLYEIAKAPYGHFTVLKLITYGNTPNFMKKISQGLKTHFVSLGIHSIGARTVETVLQLYPAAYTKHLRAEFYGKNFVVLVAEPPTSLRHLIEMLPAAKRFPILDHMKDLLNKFLGKQLLDFSFVQELLWEVCAELIRLEQEIDDHRAAGSLPKDELDGMAKKLAQFQNELIASNLLEFHAKLIAPGAGQAGSKVLTYLVQVMAAKDRKKLVKLLKGKFVSLLLASRFSFLPLTKLFSVTDDSVVLQKTLLDELRSLKLGPAQYSATGDLLTASAAAPAVDLSKPALFNVLRHPAAVKFVLALCWNYHGRDQADAASVWNQEDFDGLFMIGRLAVAKTSKKDATQRKREHLVFLQAALLRLVGGRRYLPELVRDKTAVKALEAVAYTLYPAGHFLENFARLLTDRELLEDDEEEEEEEEDQEEGEDEDEAEEEEEQEEEAEEMDVAEEEDQEEEEEGGAEQDEVGGEEVEDAEEFHQQLEEAEADKQAALKKRAAAEAEQKEAAAAAAAALLPMAEDPTAHVLAKRLLRFETKLEEVRLLAAEAEADTFTAREKSQAAGLAQFQDGQEKELTEAVQHLNTSLWALDTAEEEDQKEAGAGQIKRTAYNRFGRSLLAELRADDFAAFHGWLAVNRPCFLLYEAFRTPSLFLGLSAFFAAYQQARGLSEAEVAAVLGQTEGGRHLAKLLEAATKAAEAEAKGKGKKTEAKTPSKKAAAATPAGKKKKAVDEEEAEEEEPAAKKADNKRTKAAAKKK